jgi:hypothetical protein
MWILPLVEATKSNCYNWLSNKQSFAHKEATGRARQVFTHLALSFSVN